MRFVTTTGPGRCCFESPSSKTDYGGATVVVVGKIPEEVVQELTGGGGMAAPE
jgi:hypothetical protein